MKYYLHDSNAFNDDKISELYQAFGYEGVGLFFTILEKIAAQEKPVKTIVLKGQLHVGKRLEKCWNFMESLGIICSKDGHTFNDNLLKFSEKYQIKKEKNRERISQWRENKEVTKTVTRNKSVRNTPKDNISKVNKSKENIYRGFDHLSLSLIDFDKLILEYEKQEIDDVLDAIENHRDNKKYTNLYLTAKNWLKRRKEKDSGQKEKKSNVERNIEKYSNLKI